MQHVATTLNNIGRIHVKRDRFNEALGYYLGVLRIRRVCLGTDSLDYAATAFNAGQSLHQKGDLDEAIELYDESLRVATIEFGSRSAKRNSTDPPRTEELRKGT